MPLPDIPPGIEAQANAALNYLVAQMATIQPGHTATYGLPFQGIMTPPTIPANGNNSQPDLTLRPHYQTEDWTGKINTTARPISLEVHNHNGPNGLGYTCYGHIMIAGQHWIKAIGVGAGSQSFDWQQI